MKMKKLLSVLLASAVMIGAMTGCGGDKKKDEKKAAGGSTACAAKGLGGE